MKRIINHIKGTVAALRARWRYFHAARLAAQIVRQSKAAWPGCENAVMVNTWPPISGTTTGYKADGSATTIRWGTDGLLQSPKPATGFYTVLRFAQSVLQDVTPLENGSGVRSGRTWITHGYQWDITVRDDTQMTPPKAKDSITITDAGGLVAGTPGQVYTATVIDPSYDASPKQPGERVLRVEALLLVEGTTPGTPV